MPPSDGGTEIKIFLKGFYITMNTALNNFLSLVKDKEIAVIGIGISNRPLIKYLAENGAHVTACDRRTKEDLGEAADELLKLGVKLELGDGYIDNLTQDIIFKTPGMRFDVPQLEAARKRGALVTSEMEAFFDVCPCKIIAVTGSDGKTTTPTLIQHMARRKYRKSAFVRHGENERGRHCCTGAFEFSAAHNAQISVYSRYNQHIA